MGSIGDNGFYDWSAQGAFCLRANLGNTSGLSEHNGTFITDVYPNPAQGGVTFSWSGNDNVADISIVDMTGKTVSHFVTSESKSTTQLEPPCWSLHRANHHIRNGGNFAATNREVMILEAFSEALGVPPGASPFC